MTRMIATRSIALVAAAVLALTGLAACASSGGSPKAPQSSQLIGAADQSGAFDGSPLDPPQPRPSFTLDDTSGTAVSFSQLTSKHPTLLYFGYTNCPDVCPTTMADFQQALMKLPASVAKQIDIVFVSTDVKHDTGPIIKQWLSNFYAGTRATWIGLRGTQTQIDAAQAAAHAPFVAEDGGVTHSSQVLLYGPDNYAHLSFLESTTLAQQLAHDLPLVAAGKS